MNITITKTTHPGTLPPSDQLGFGTVFTDHMFLMDYSADKGWHDARVVPYGPITMSPAASVLHYGTEVFEGMKAYRRPDGGVQLFRPWENVARLNRSCERLGLPQLDPDDALQAIKTVVKVDENWVPSDPGTSLYIRPFLYGTDPTLALHGVHEATFAIILSPSGSYFKNGLQPVPIMVETEDVRAVRGGTGEAKCGGNYGAANRAGDRAIEKGCLSSPVARRRGAQVRRRRRRHERHVQDQWHRRHPRADWLHPARRDAQVRHRALKELGRARRGASAERGRAL